jgi:hypothetical protein
MWAAWPAYLSAFRDILKLDLPEHKAYAHWEILAQESGYRWMHEDFCMVTDLPDVILKDDQHQPHCETGPSHKWSDGWSLYHWHGVSIPAEWIENRPLKNVITLNRFEKILEAKKYGWAAKKAPSNRQLIKLRENHPIGDWLTAKTAITWPNIEQRRAACEIIGWAKILKELDAKVINKDDDPMIGTLLEVDLPDSGKERFIHVLCGTGREFAIPVPRDCGNTALAANAWTYGLDAESFKPEGRT